jgi:hypothetical protein
MASPLPYLRVLAVGVFTLALAACGGGGGGGGFARPPGPNPSFAQCDPGTQVQLANPQPGQFGVPTNIGSIIVVANGNNNILFATYPQWFVVLFDNFGNSINGGPLNLTSDPSGPHPYPSDFYYSSSIGNLPPGTTWNAGLVNSNSNCAPDPLGSYST